MKGLKSSSAIVFGRPHWWSLSSGPTNDDGTAGVVNAFAEKVLAETALLALECVGQGLERAIVGSAQNATATAVVEEGVNSFLEHALFVADDDVRGAKFHELLSSGCCD